MRTVSYRLVDLNNATLNLGFVGENEHTRVIFDSKKMFEQYPDAVASLAVKPPVGDPYPAVTTRDGDFVIWDVTDADLAAQGMGEVQLSFTEDGKVAKTYKAKTRISGSIMPTGEIPSPVDDWLTRANAALADIPPTIDDALEEAKESGEFKGDPGEDGYTPVKGVDYFDGKDGKDGQDGSDGYSPSASVSKSGKTATISVTDKSGTTTATVSDGADGEDGQDGTDGVSPTVTVTDITGGHRITITDATGSHSFDVMDGVIPDISGKADKTDTVLTSTLSRGRKAETTVGEGSFAFGNDVTASGAYSHAEGNGTTASGASSHAEGNNTNATSNGSHAEGSTTRASGNYAHAEGSNTTASGNYTHAEGAYTKATGRTSHAEGTYTEAKNLSQHVSGEYNVVDPSGNPATNRGTYVEIIGNGTADNARSNARALDWNGNERIMGDLYIGCNADSTGGTKVAKETTVETPSGTTVTITGVDNHRYICGELATLSITAPHSGIIDVVFESGTTPTVLTVTGITFPEWFDPTTDIEADTTYEINVLDGRGVVSAWN